MPDLFGKTILIHPDDNNGDLAKISLVEGSTEAVVGSTNGDEHGCRSGTLYVRNVQCREELVGLL